MRSDTLDKSIKFKGLFNCQFREERVMLRTISDQIPSLAELCLDIVTLNSNFSHGWSYVSCQTLEGSRFASSVDTKQGKALTIIKTKSCLFHCLDRRATKCVIFFLEIADSDAVIAVLFIISLSFNTFLFSQNIIIHHENGSFPLRFT